MIENIEQAKERFKGLVDFYKLNDPNNYDYDDRDLISMKLVLEEIEKLEKRNKEIYEGFMATQEELKEYAEENERLYSIIKEAREYIEEKIIAWHNSKPEVVMLDYDKIMEILDKGE